MKKNFLRKLLNAYNGIPRSKKILRFKSKDIQELENFLDSPAMMVLGSDEPIKDIELFKLIGILNSRENEIKNTKNSYEKRPGSRTNKLFKRIYDELWKDLTKDKNLTEDEKSVMTHTLLTREFNHYEAALKKGAKSGDSVLACKLGTMYLTGKEITEDKNLVFPGQKYKNDFVTVVSVNTEEVKNVRIVTDVKLKKNIDQGLHWLNVAAQKGNVEAAQRLTSFYMGEACDDSLNVKHNVKHAEAIKYDKLIKKIEKKEKITQHKQFILWKKQDCSKQDLHKNCEKLTFKK